MKYVSYKTDIEKICRGLDRWTKTLFYAPFRNAGESLPIGTQQDGISCGICVLNGLEHEIFGARLFTHDRRNVLRVQYFVDVMKLLLDRVSMTHNALRIFVTHNVGSRHESSTSPLTISSSSIQSGIHGISTKRYLKKLMTMEKGP